jgi:uncharacterized protein DUF4390
LAATAPPSRPKSGAPRSQAMPSRFSSVTASNPGRRRTLAALIVVAGLAILPRPAAADEISVKQAELSIDEGDVVLSADFDFAINPTLEEALQKGVPLYFTIDSELSRRRWYWLDEKVVQWSLTYRVSYTALTRQYRVATGPLGQQFESLADVQRFIGHLSARPVMRADALIKGARYDAAIRLRLDVNQLPKPFQLSALANRDWQLASEWFRWSITP